MSRHPLSHLRRPSRTRSATACVFAAALLAVTSAPAQQAPDRESFLGRENAQNVYVRDSAVAVEAFALAQRMERLKEWDKAADALQEIVEKHPDRILPSRTDEKNVITQYTSVVLAAQERLAHWPAEGLAVYRARYETAAAVRLEAAGDDPAALHGVFSQYFVTEAGLKAGLKLIGRYLETGEFAAAAWIGQRLLDWYPSLGELRAGILYRVAIAQHLGGDGIRASERLAELSGQYSQARGVVRGQEVVLAESLARELEMAPSLRPADGSDSWPTFGGDNSRARVSGAAGRLGTRIYEVPYVLPTRAMPAVQQTALRQLVEEERRDRQEGFMLGVMPVADHGELFFQDNARIYAVNIESGLPLPGWSATWGDRGGSYALSEARPLPRNQLFTLSVTNDAVLAVMGVPDRSAPGREVEIRLGTVGTTGGTRLVCLDRRSGAERWVVSPRQIPGDLFEQRQVIFGGTPIVAGDSVFIMAKAGAPMQFEDTWVLCFGLADGRMRWSCYLASGYAAMDPWGGDGGVSSSGFSDMAYVDGRLYALTNLGALAAVDPHSGTILWLNLYPRPRPAAADFRMRWDRARLPTPDKPWTHNPVMVSGSSVFILPDDGQEISVYDAGTGAPLKSIPISQLDQARTLLGVVGEELIACSDKRVFCINWRQHDAAPGRPHAGTTWIKELLPVGGRALTSIRGRGLVTSQAVFVPTYWAIHRISLKSGRLEQSYPSEGQWDQDEGPGNVLVTQDQVVVAAAERVNVYTDLELAQARLDAAVAAAPQDPGPRLKYAEVMFVAGKNQTAMQRLDEAVTLLGGIGTLQRGESRDRLFGLAMAFAQKLVGVQPTSEDREVMIGELFERAAAAADTPAQQVHYRTVRGRHLEQRKDAAGAIGMYQQILLDPALRAVQYAPDASGAMPASALAQQAIARLIRQAGREAYAPHDRAAAEQLAIARQSGDPQALLALAQAYPNAQVAPEAMLAAAEGFESAGDSRAATRVLTQVYRKYRDAAEMSSILEAQARNFLAMPDGLGVALGRLAEAASLSGGKVLRREMKLPDGSTIAAGVAMDDALRQLRDYSVRMQIGSLPDLGLPVPPTPAPGEKRVRVEALASPSGQLMAEDVLALLVPPRENMRHDRVVCFSPRSGVSVYRVGESVPVLRVAMSGAEPVGAAWVGTRLLVWGGDQIMLLDETRAAPVWTMHLAALAPIELAAAGEFDAEMPGGGENDVELLRENQQVQIRARRRGGMRVVGPGMIVGQMPGQQPPPDGSQDSIAHVKPAGDRVVLGTSGGRVVALDLETGQAAWQVRLSHSAAIDQIAASNDFAVARIARQDQAQIAAMDMLDGQIVSRRLFATAGEVPFNMALSPDGMLVFTLVNRLCGMDLYEPSRDMTFVQPERQAGREQREVGAAYYGAVQPDQLVVADGRILAVSDNGRFVRVHSLQTGRELHKPLSTASDNWDVHLIVVGPRLYVVNQRTVSSYNLEKPEESWTGYAPSSEARSIQGAIIGQNYLVLLDQMRQQAEAAEPGQPPDQAAASPRYRLLMYARYPAREGETTESGRLDYAPIVSHPVGIAQWQPVQGGFCYRTLDRKLHLLRGAAPGPGPTAP
jgi:outer membrane protein assembly factor BamB/tetratricopeptide (TPR) repeat protein